LLTAFIGALKPGLSCQGAGKFSMLRLISTKYQEGKMLSKNKFMKLLAVIASSFMFSGSVTGVAHAAQIQPETGTVVTHSTDGTDDTLTITAAVWNPAPSVAITAQWQYSLGACGTSGDFTFFSTSQGGTAVTSSAFVIPAVIYVDPNRGQNFTDALSTAGIRIMGISVWSDSPDFGSSPGSSYEVGTGFCQTQQSSRRNSQTPTPAKYSGPEFSGLSGMGVMTGSSAKLQGKRLNEINSIEIGGKAVVLNATSATELELSLPEGLAPGLYDLVINSSAGKLTHINAIRVREPLRSVSVTTASKGRISNDQYLEHSLIASMQVPELTKARCVVNASSLATARAMANRLCAVVKASNPNIETTIVEPRSTVKGDAVYARVSYGWN